MVIADQEGSQFYLPDLNIFCSPRMGDVMVLKSNQIQHCTRRRSANGMFGISVFMHASLFPMWREMQKNIEIMNNGGKLTKGHQKQVQHWLLNNSFYQNSK